MKKTLHVFNLPRDISPFGEYKESDYFRWTLLSDKEMEAAKVICGSQYEVYAVCKRKHKIQRYSDKKNGNKEFREYMVYDCIDEEMAKKYSPENGSFIGLTTKQLIEFSEKLANKMVDK